MNAIATGSVMPMASRRSATTGPAPTRSLIGSPCGSRWPNDAASLALNSLYASISLVNAERTRSPMPSWKLQTRDVTDVQTR